MSFRRPLCFLLLLAYFKAQEVPCDDAVCHLQLTSKLTKRIESRAVAEGSIHARVADDDDDDAATPEDDDNEEEDDAAKQGPTPLKPSGGLKWTKQEDTHIKLPNNKTLIKHVGHLLVHLDPFNLSSPQIHLQVSMLPHWTQPPPGGPLLVHCGGPSTDDEECITFGSQFVSTGYNVFTISQRGVGNNKPSLNCNLINLPEKGHGPYVVSNFTDCPCRLPDGTPMIGEAWADIDPASEVEVRDLLSKMTERSSRCYKGFQMPDGDYNFLDYVGTQYLAKDIDQLRKAIGAKGWSIYGKSYGAYVGAVYASAYPDNVFKLVLNGNIVPSPDKNALSTGSAAGIEQALNELLYNCKEHPKECSLEDPEKQYQEVLMLLRSKDGLTAPTASGADFRLTVGYLIGWIQKQLSSSEGEGWPVVTRALASLQRGNLSVRSHTVAEILNTRCYLCSGDAANECKKGTKHYTWHDYDVCIGSGHISGGVEAERFIDQTAVLGADLVGRYTVDDVVRLWRRAYSSHGPEGAGAFVGLMAAFFDWPAIPTPPALLGNPSVKALVIGNLYDPSASYSWAQDMHRMFPSGRMMTWQGAGNVLTSKAAYDPQGSSACFSHVQKYLAGSLDDVPNGYTCHQINHVPVGFIEW